MRTIAEAEEIACMESEAERQWRFITDIEAMAEDEVRTEWNTDSKQEFLDMLKEEYEDLVNRTEQRKLETEHQEDRMDYDALCRVLGLSRWA